LHQNRGQRERLWSKVMNDTPIRRLANSAVNDKLVQGRHQKVALNLFLRFDSCTIDPKGEILLLLRRDESCFER
jgi:hypothetical protein